MPRLGELQHKFIAEFIGDTIPDGVILISEKYETSAHNCPCGCDEKIVIPLGENGWEATYKDGRITLNPSLANRTPCKSHYYIRDGKVVWCE